MQAIAAVPVTLAHGSVEVTGSVNRSPGEFVVDTSAERTVLSESAVRSYLLGHRQRSISQLAGLGGQVVDADMDAELQVGNAHDWQRLAEAHIPITAGLLRADMLGDYDVEFDLSPPGGDHPAIRCRS